MQLDTITELLNIPNHKVSYVIQNRKDCLYFVLKQERVTPPVCSGCGHVHDTPVHSKGTVVVEDLRISGKRVFLYVTKRKVRCQEDDRIRVEELDWIKGRFTKRFTTQVNRLTSITTNQEAGWFLGLDDEAVDRVVLLDLEGERDARREKGGVEADHPPPLREDEPEDRVEDCFAGLDHGVCVTHRTASGRRRRPPR